MTRRLAGLILSLTVVSVAVAGSAQQVATTAEWLVSRAEVGRTG